MSKREGGSLADDDRGKSFERIAINGIAESRRDLRPAAIHHLPCKIAHDGPADVESYFRVEETEVSSSVCDEDGKPLPIKSATFRGRKLMGADVLLPEGMFGVVLEPREDFSHKRIRGEDQEAEQWDCHAVFDRFTAWNYDQLPMHSDEIRRWSEWAGVASALHS
mmetsp:Transcript_7720/g.13557  ORF Transcript_7720/g.13557 Transcript_7720/m.13557 type:complete len:165 (-) Transcript_7720:95-589(-)